MIKTSAETVVSPSFDTDLRDDDLEELGDEQLLDLVRLGSSKAYAVLFARYRVAGHRFARFLSNSVDAKDIVSETFAQILHQLRQGRGPDTSFRSYLFTSIRREAGRRAKMGRRVSPTDDVAVMDRKVPLFDGRVDWFERDIVRAAFESLPERWRTVLWRMEVDGLKPHEIAPSMGMKPNGVSALACRAREGLRRAYLHHHVASMSEKKSDSACAEIRHRLAGFIRGTATTRDASLVDSHLRSCAICMDVHLELEEVNAHLGAVASVIAVAFAAPASGVVGGLVAKAAIMAKSVAATVGSTAAVVATTVTVAQLPALPPAEATTVHARPHQAVQHEPDRTQGPAADREPAQRERSEASALSTLVSPQQTGTGDSTTTPADPSGTSSPPVSVNVGNDGASASVDTRGGGVNASVDTGGGVSASVDTGGGGVSASVDVGDGGASASVDVGDGAASANVDVNRTEASASVDVGRTEASATVNLAEPKETSVKVNETEIKVADVEKTVTDTAREVVENE